MSTHELSLCERVCEALSAKRSTLMKLGKDFFNKRIWYEKSFCACIDAIHVNEPGDKRYWDCILAGVKVELKKNKGGTIWLDDVRNSEVWLAKRGIRYRHEYFDQAKQDSVTIFIQGKNDQLYSLHVVDTKVLVEHLTLNEEWAKFFIDRYHLLRSKREGNNNQHSIRWETLDTIAHHIFYFQERTLKIPKRVIGGKKKLKEHHLTILNHAKKMCDEEHIFTKRQIDAKIPEIQEAHPTILRGKKPTNSMSAFLQVLRDAGMLEFQPRGKRGEYRILAPKK